MTDTKNLTAPAHSEAAAPRKVAVVTGATGGKVSPFNFIIPQVLVWVFLICATSVSVYRDMSLGHLNIATIWNGINLVALTAFMVVAYLEGRAAVGKEGRAHEVALRQVVQDEGGAAQFHRDQQHAPVPGPHQVGSPRQAARAARVLHPEDHRMPRPSRRRPAAPAA